MSGLDEAREYAAKALLFRGAPSIRRMRLEAAIRGLLLATAKPTRTKKALLVEARP